MSVQIAAGAMRIVGKDVDRSWTVRENAGALLGRYASWQAAHRFGERERGARPAMSIASSAGAPVRLLRRLTFASARKARNGSAQDG